MTSEKKDDELNFAYTEVLRFAEELVKKYDPLVAAAVMSSISLSMYKTVLEMDDFNKLIDEISNSRDSVRSFYKEPTLQ